MVCGFLKDKLGNVVNIGGTNTSHKSPSMLHSTPSAKDINPAPRKNTRRQSREVDDIEDEEEDDEDAGDSLAYSAYVRSRMVDIGGETAPSTSSSQNKRATSSITPTQQQRDETARPDAVLDTLLRRMEATTDLLSSSTDIAQSILLADLVKSLAEAARSVKRLRECY